MGIRFRCHHCQHELHVKDFQGGKRGRCPECKGSFRIPQADSEYSLPAMAEPGASESGLAESGSSTPESNSTQAAPQVMTLAASGKPTARTTSPPTAAFAGAVSKTKRSAATSPASVSDITNIATAPVPSSEPEPVPPPDDVVPGLPQAIVDFPQSIWHVRPASGGQYGPAPAELFGQWMIEGRIDRDAWVWRDDWADWQQASNVFSEFYPKVPGTSAPHPLSPPPASPSPVSPALASPSLASSPQLTTSAPGQLPAADASLAAAGVATAVNNPRRDRRLKQRKRNMVLVAILVVIFIALVGTLAYVLLTQGE